MRTQQQILKLRLDEMTELIVALTAANEPSKAASTAKNSDPPPRDIDEILKEVTKLEEDKEALEVKKAMK